MQYEKTPEGSLKLVNPGSIDYVNYWGGEHSTLEEQVYNVNGYVYNGITKTEAIYKHIKSGSVLEIGAAPGEFLRYCKHKGHATYGICPENDPFIQSHSQSEIFTGYFTDYNSRKRFDNVVAMDVFEHIENGTEFLNHAVKYLKKGGKVIFMLPILDDCKDIDKMKHPEHIWLYSRSHLESMGFNEFDTWADGHSIAIINT